MNLIRGGCSFLLVLVLFSCGDNSTAPASRAPIVLKVGASPDLSPAVGAPPAVAAPLVFPALPIYDVVTSVLSPTTTSPAAEEHVAISPTNYCIWVGAISDFGIRGGFNTTKYAVTYNFGDTWQESYLPNNGTTSGSQLLTSDGQQWDFNSDPVVAFDRLGNVYIANLYFNNGDKSNGIYVAKKAVGSAGPLTFTSADILPASVNLNKPIQVDEDKEWIAVDNSTGSSAFQGRVYISWSRFNSNGPGNSRIMVTSSGTQGATWSAPVQVSPVSQNGLVQGSQVAVGPDGTVYVCWLTIVAGGNRMFFSKSTDGGASWSTPASITPTFQEISFTASYRYDSFPSLAVNPNPVSGQAYGEIYVVYPDQPNANSSIKFVRSTDGGTSFSAPVALNDVATSQRLMPSIAVDDRNTLNVCWFDTRNGADAQTYDIYAARGSVSTGSLVWGVSNVRVTPASITIPAGTSFIGDYGGMASSSFDDGVSIWGFAVPVWTGSGGTRILKAAVLGYHP